MTMGPSEFTRHLEQSPIAPVYLFKGEADLLMEDAWNRLVEKIVPLKARRFNGERLSAKEHSAVQVLERLNTLPMFGPKQLVMVQQIEAWPKDQRILIQDYIRNPRPSACLILATTQKRGFESLESTVASAGQVVHFSVPTERDAPRWLQERAKTYRKHLVPQAALLLIEQVGVDLFRLDRELEKLSAYVGEREKIEWEDVRQAVSSQRSFSVFELLRYVSHQQSSQAIFSLRKLILSGEHPLGILALLARQIRILWQIKDGLEQGVALSEMAQKLGLSQSVAKNYTQEATRFSEPELRHMHYALRETDLAIKSTATAPDVILESLVLKMCRTKQKSP